MAPHIATVVIPAAGRGTRLLPATKATPKELLSIYDRPALQFAMDEAIGLGAERIVIVTHQTKGAIRDYLTPDPEQIRDLGSRGKPLLAAALTDIEVPKWVEIVFVDQHTPLGLGHAILCAERQTLPGPFGVILPDDVIFGRPCLSEMAEHYSEGHMIAAMEVGPEETGSYGIFRFSTLPMGRNVAVTGIVEKPTPEQAPSRLAAVGRYILDPGIFSTLHHVGHGVGGEIQLTDAIARDAGTVALSAFRFSGTRYDCGTRDGLVDATLARQGVVRNQAAGIFAVAQGAVGRVPPAPIRSGRANAGTVIAFEQP
ncbi:MAG: 2-C-methyl-D-erythritol 4-phosphate cytidylyltransferase [Pararhodobacter sp.]|nr:2-C-methyl-D-erythritol 4-phosphate cytidylyltransferase [Pararhodobacter sp.]